MAMIESVLIANRGEIARRVIRTARRMGVRTIAVYSEADADAPHVREADVAVPIGPSPASESYLIPARILEAARQTGAAAIHPGYGFLSENAAFAEAVIAAGLVWIGPPPSAIRAMGLKDAAKRLMAEAGVPVTPGYLGDDQSLDRLRAEADRIGYPVLIKAVAGGGGKGMRRVDRAEDFAEALAGAQREGAASFGEPRVLLETYVTRPRHIEVQVFADSRGEVVHLFERDCSLQRRHQKVIEEAPAPGMSDEARAQVTSAAIRAARAVGYVGAGTVEFIADASEGLRGDRIWFMEMNTRLQVEHPVTEAITGVDLVEWQLRVASGEPLPLSQDRIAIRGHAMEARLYAENPATGFLPSIGPLDHFRLPAPGDGVRVDSGVEQGGEISPFYDPMIAKIIVHAETRTGAAAKLAAACAEAQVWPVRTNAGFLVRCATNPDFIAAHVDTGFISAQEAALIDRAPSPAVLAAAARAMVAEGPAPWSASGFRLNATPANSVPVEIDGARCEAPLTGDVSGVTTLPRHDGAILFASGEAYVATKPRSRGLGEVAAGDGQIVAPMPGRVVSVDVAQGDAVTKGQRLMVLEAMKMEHALTAPFDGVVEHLAAKTGDQVGEGAVLARLKTSATNDPHEAVSGSTRPAGRHANT
jgi:acetyl/propionyl-CoA carboxylase alpha subunit